MEKEFIVETETGSYYAIRYKHNFWQFHGGRFACEQLKGELEELKSAAMGIVMFGNPDRYGQQLDLSDLVLGASMLLRDSRTGKTYTTSRVTKIYERRQ